MNNKFILSLLMFSLVGFMACHSSKKSTQSSKKATVATKKGKGKKGKNNDTEVTIADPKVVKLRSSDSLFVTLERTPCSNACPSYKIEIYYKGYAVYHGYTFAERTGDFHTVLPKEKLVKIFNYAKGIKYFSLNDSYVDPNLTDVATTITSMQVAKKTKTITDGHTQTPSELIFFEKLIDESFDKVIWKQSK